MPELDSLIERLKKQAHDPNHYKEAAIQTRQAEQIFGKGRFGYSSVVPPPATIEEVEAAEQELDFKLPNLLREIYTQVANGGFGPGYGLLGLPPDGATDDQGKNIVSLGLAVPDPNDLTEYTWPDNLLPIFYYGCAIYACLDCTNENGPIFMWDSGELDKSPWVASLREWLENWLIKLEA